MQAIQAIKYLGKRPQMKGVSWNILERFCSLKCLFLNMGLCDSKSLIRAAFCLAPYLMFNEVALNLKISQKLLENHSCINKAYKLTIEPKTFYLNNNYKVKLSSRFLFKSS